MLIQLLEYLKEPYAFGNEEGRDIFNKLQRDLAAQPEERVFGISLKGVEATDASFPRESVVSLAKMYKGEKGFYLCDFASKDLLDNWDYAAQAKGQPLIIKTDGGYDVIGPPITDSAKELLDFIMSKGVATTALVAEKFDVSTQNASAKLKKLLDQGLILGSKEAAETGGLEFIFTAIR